LILRPYQGELQNLTRQSFRNGFTSPVVVSPTGSGKTVIFADTAKRAAEKGNRVLILVHRQEILEQTLLKLYSMGVTAGKIAAGSKMTTNKIQVAMVQTLARRLNFVRKPDLIIIDECHHSMASTWLNIFNHWPDVPRIGFTATPCRLDGKGLKEIADDMVQGPTIASLVEDGYLTFPVIKKPAEEHVMKFHVKMGDFDKKEQAEKLSSKKIVGDVIEHYRQYLWKEPTVCFVPRLDYGEMIAKMFRNVGLNAVLVQGGQKYRAERDRGIKGLSDGSVNIVMSAEVISEGVDVPAMTGVIMLRRTMSLSMFLQMAGRPLRTVYAPGYDLNTKEGRLLAIQRGPKPRAYILDHVGNYYLHGHVLSDRQWSLDSVKKDPRKEEPPETRICPDCGGVWPGRPTTCPDCGYEWIEFAVQAKEVKPPEIIAGELVDALPDGIIEEGEKDPLIQLLKRVQTLAPAVRQKAMIAEAYKLAAIKGDSAKSILKALGEAAGYKKGWSHWVWERVKKNVRRA
jgi:superfamily II DNA or RNA helicase